MSQHEAWHNPHVDVKAGGDAFHTQDSSHGSHVYTKFIKILYLLYKNNLWVETILIKDSLDSLWTVSYFILVWGFFLLPIAHFLCHLFSIQLVLIHSGISHSLICQIVQSSSFPFACSWSMPFLCQLYFCFWIFFQDCVFWLLLLCIDCSANLTSTLWPCAAIKVFLFWTFPMIPACEPIP